MTQKIVAKFGGSSVADASCIKRSAQLAFNQKAQIIVVSATYGTTNTLEEIRNKALNQTWEEVQPIVAQIRDKHLQIADELEVPYIDKELILKLTHELETMARGVHLLKECSPRAMDTIYSIGERISSILFTRALSYLYQDQKQVHNLDVRTVLKTDDDFSKATPLIGHCAELAKQIIKPGHIYVTQGFIGSTLEGLTTTLGRGGSDYSAAILAEAIDATELQIWTDVAGIATTDPRICPKARQIEEITFQEAAELATFGAKILHPTTLSPAKRKQIPVFVGSSYENEKRGTWIKEQSTSAPLLRAMALRQKQSLLTLSTPKMLNTHGFLYEIFKVFNEFRISVDSITTSEIAVALTVNDETLLNKKFIDRLETLGQVDIETDLSLVSLIGNNINHTPGLASKVFKIIDGINIRMICQGASKHNFCFLVRNGDGKKAVAALHEVFLENA